MCRIGSSWHHHWIHRPTAGSCIFKASPFREGFFKMGFLMKTIRNFDKKKQEVTPGKIKQPRRKPWFWLQQINKDGWQGRKWAEKNRGSISDEIYRNLFKTKHKKSTFCTFNFCVVFAVHDSVNEFRRATAGMCKFKVSPMHVGIFMKNILHKNRSKKTRQAKAKS